jgi:hypothetical protein
MMQVSLEALWWVVLHNLTPLNYVLALEASIWFIERAAMEHPKQKVGQRNVDTCCWTRLLAPSSQMHTYGSDAARLSAVNSSLTHAAYLSTGACVIVCAANVCYSLSLS